MAPRTAHVSAPVLMAGHCWPTTLQETLRHAQAGLLQSPVDHCSFPLGPVHTRLYLCPPSVPVSPQPCGSSVIKSHCPSKSDSLGTPSAFVGSDDQVIVGPRTFATVREFTLIQILSLSHSHPFSVLGSNLGLSWAWPSSFNQKWPCLFLSM